MVTYDTSHHISRYLNTQTVIIYFWSELCQINVHQRGLSILITGHGMMVSGYSFAFGK